VPQALPGTLIHGSGVARVRETLMHVKPLFAFEKRTALNRIWLSRWIYQPLVLAAAVDNCGHRDGFGCNRPLTSHGETDYDARRELD